MAGISIGIAGWALARAALPAFPPPGFGSHLRRYAAVFDTVEINSSFYRPHKAQTYARWAGEVPAGFRFAVKLPKSITHDKRLLDCEAELDRFTFEAGALAGKLGWILVQLPPSLPFHADAAAALFAGLRGRLAAPCNPLLACEARHGSWFGADASAMLREAGVIRVIADPPAGEPGPYVATSEACYIRLHGSPLVYRSVYEPGRLAKVAAFLRGQSNALVIFDNTMSGTQALQALHLQALLHK